MAGNSRKNARSKHKPSIDTDEDLRHHATVISKNQNLKLRKDRNRNRLSPRVIFLLCCGIFVFGISTFFIYRRLKNSDYGVHKPRVVTPFPAPKLMDLPQFQGEHRENLYWGTYRPHVYLGIRARTPQSLVAGLMWIGVKDGQLTLRHVCQDSDGLSTYGWTHHNGRDYGRQLIIDHALTLETSFLKLKEIDSGYGGDWAVRIDMQSNKSDIDDNSLRTGHLFFYVANEGGEAVSVGGNILDIRGSSLLASGSHSDIGAWQLHLESKNNLEVHYSGFKTPHIHNLSELVQLHLAYQVQSFGRLELPDNLDHSPNVLVFQISAGVPFKVDLVFVSGTDLKSSRVDERISTLTGESLDKALMKKKNEFEEEFERRFNLSEKADSGSIVVGKAALANLLGGIGYFYGQSKISVPGNYDL